MSAAQLATTAVVAGFGRGTESAWKDGASLGEGLMFGGDVYKRQDYVLINKTSSTIYQNNQIVINTDIRNATELILRCV